MYFYSVITGAIWAGCIARSQRAQVGLSMVIIWEADLSSLILAMYILIASEIPTCAELIDNLDSCVPVSCGLWNAAPCISLEPAIMTACVSR